MAQHETPVRGLAAAGARTQHRRTQRLVGAALLIAVIGLVFTAASARTYRIAQVSTASDDDRSRILREAFLVALRELGYVEGTNLIYDRRYADGDVSRIPALVDEVIAVEPDLLLATEEIALILRTKTKTIPIVLLRPAPDEEELEFPWSAFFERVREGTV